MAEANQQSIVDRRAQRFGLVVGPGLFLLLFLLPPIGPLTSDQQAMAAIGTLMTVWWLTEAIPIPATAMIPLFLFPLLGITTAQQAATPYANHLIYLFLGGFVLALGIERSSLHKRIALHVIRIAGTSPSRIVLGFMLATAFLSMWISNTATALLMLPIAIAVTRQIAELVPDSGSGKGRMQGIIGVPLLLGIAYAASIGGIGTLIGTPPNIVFAGVFDKMYGHRMEVGFLQWMLFAIPLVVIFLPFAWWYLTRIVAGIPLQRLAGATGGKQVIREELKALGPVSTVERRMAVAFLTTALAWIFRSPIELGGLRIPGITDLLPGISDSTVAMFAAVALFVLPGGSEGYKRLMDWDTVQHGVPWGILILFGGGFALAEGFQSTGLTLLLGQSIAALEGLPIIVHILLVCLLLTFLTELTSNTATAAVLIPVVASAAIAMGQNPLVLMVPATISASCAFMLPVATPPNAIVYSAGWISIRQMARAGLALNIAGAVLITLLMYTLGVEVFGITLGSVPSGLAQP